MGATSFQVSFLMFLVGKSYGEKKTSKTKTKNPPPDLDSRYWNLNPSWLHSHSVSLSELLTLSELQFLHTKSWQQCSMGQMWTQMRIVLQTMNFTLSNYLYGSAAIYVYAHKALHKRCKETHIIPYWWSFKSGNIYERLRLVLGKDTFFMKLS